MGAAEYLLQGHGKRHSATPLRPWKVAATEETAVRRSCVPSLVCALARACLLSSHQLPEPKGGEGLVAPP